ncbi:hypothetical protein EDD37DRAFT_610501 [Exophiala viscosa]|uniref:uncharacterized protein n=1 Tax=Exophiala viscosa TaxID=2486360 RepID=UPI0021945F04|nr:hypothetical protein EDD37DRAFT_610501 [Exophiala viscosa]
MTQAENTAKQRENEKRRDWFRLLATALAVNIAVWLSLIFQVYDIRHNQSRRITYESIAWYNTLEWESHIDYNESIFPPTFAFASGGDFVDTALASFAGGTTLCTFPQYSRTKSTDCPVADFNRTRQTLEIYSEAYGHLDAYIFNPHELQPNNNTYVDLTNRVLLQTDNSDDLEHDYSPQLLQTPYIFAAIYDPRIDLATALHCGLVAFTEIPAMGTNTITLSAQHVTDDLGIVKPPDDKTTCSKIYTSALTMKNPPYTSYSFKLGSMPTSNLSTCDTKLNSNAFCISQVLLRYGSRVVSRMESVPGIAKTDILIAEGAIVGAVQFFMWFFGIFAL